MEHNESALAAIAKRAEEIKAEEAELKKKAEEARTSAVEEMADMAEGNKEVQGRYYQASMKQHTAGSALDSAVQKRYDERNRATEELNVATFEKSKLAVKIHDLRAQLIADEKTALPEQKGEYRKLLEQLEEQSKLLSGAAESDIVKARETLAQATAQAEELKKKYGEMAREQENMARQPVKFAVDEVLKSRMGSKEGDIAPYDNRFGPKETLEAEVNALLGRRLGVRQATDVVREFGEKLVKEEARFANYEMNLSETIAYVDEEIKRLMSGELNALTQKRDEVLELGAKAQGAWFGKKQKANDAARARDELSKTREVIAKKLEDIRFAASQRTGEIVELQRDIRDDTAELKKWLSVRKTLLSPTDYEKMDGNIVRYAALLKRQKDVAERRQQYHHVTIEQKLAEVKTLAGI